MQIRTSLTLRFILIAAGILAAVLFYVYQAFRLHSDTSFYENLETQVDFTIRTTLLDESKLKPYPPFNTEDNGGNLPYRDNISIFTDAYECVFTMHPDMEPVGSKSLQAIYHDGSLRFLHRNLHAWGKTTTAPSGKEYIVVAEGYCDPSGVIQLRNILIFSFLIGILAVALAGWFFAGQALEPVNKIVRQVDGIGPTDLSKRVKPDESGDELARLAITFNRLLDRVEHAFKLQKQFLSNISHEMKNPLTVIRTQLDVALQRSRTPEEYQTTIASVLDDVGALAEVEARLLQLARVHSESTQIPKETVRLDEVIWQARENILKNNQEYRISIEFEALPEDDSTMFIKVNEPLLRTALLNLMENGCKYSPDNRVVVKVAFCDNGGHVVEVKDNGPGIPPDEVKLIFEPFYRSPRHLNIKGTGIGLPLTDSILKLHNIELTIRSVQGQGTTFILEFPSEPLS